MTDNPFTYYQWGQSGTGTPAFSSNVVFDAYYDEMKQKQKKRAVAHSSTKYEVDDIVMPRESAHTSWCRANKHRAFRVIEVRDYPAGRAGQQWRGHPVGGGGRTPWVQSHNVEKVA